MIAAGLFRAMNTEVEVLDAPVAEVEELFLEWHRRLTRFDPSSELSALNASGGRWFAASPLLFEVVERALHWAAETDGVFDPTVLNALEMAGYSRSFELLSDTTWRPTPARPANWRDVQLQGRHIFVPAGVRLDLGGIAKGMAVDRSLARRQIGMVNAGGDLLAKGRDYLVGIQDPTQPERDLVTLAVRDRGVATSATWKRRWSSGGHHLIDTRAGLPSATDVLACSVVASTCEEAEVCAKVALLLGLRHGSDWLCARGLAGLLVGNDGTLLATPGFEDYLAAGN